MTLSNILPPERVREIAEQAAKPSGGPWFVAVNAITAAESHIARAVLLWAAERLEEGARLAHSREVKNALEGHAYVFRTHAKEITDAN